MKEAGYGVVPGTATFVDARSVRVGDQQLTADRILIATGSRTAVPPIPGIEDIEWLDHVSALELEEVPESLLVVGAGPVGLEFAQIFARFGSRVTVVNSGPQIAARSDADAAGELQAALEEEGIEIVLNSGIDSFARGSNGIEASIGGRTLDVSHVLLASGRLPNVEELEPDRIGLEIGRGGIRSTIVSARTSTASGRQATSPPARCSRRSRSTRPASQSRTCSATAPGVPTTRCCRPRSSRIPSWAASG